MSDFLAPVDDAATGLPRLRLGHFPTPFEAAPRLADALHLEHMWIKREDLSGYALGGNKLRKLDFLLAEAIDGGADTLVATAGHQSNFCRALAGAAAKASLGCHLLLRATGEPAIEGNLLLDRMFGAHVSYIAATDPWDPAIRAGLDRIADGIAARGNRPHVVQLTGASAPLAAAAWVSGAAELARDFEQIRDVPGIVALACGSGLTAAGLALGFKHLGVDTRVVAFSVQQPAERLRPWIAATANAAAERLGIATRIDEDDVMVIDDGIGPGYGIPTAAAIEALALAGRTEALVLDPVYTGKALAGVATLARSGGMWPRASAVFLHSGGTPGLFAQTKAVAEALA